MSLILQSLQLAPQIEYIWYDYWCLPQKQRLGEPRTATDQALFETCLRNLRQFQVRVPMFFLPLWANQDDYFRRGWCFAEALWGLERTVTFPNVNALSHKEEGKFLQERCLFLMVMIAEGPASAREFLHTIFRDTKEMTGSTKGKEAAELINQLLDFEPTEYCKVMAMITRANVLNARDSPAAYKPFEQVEQRARELGDDELVARGLLGQAIASETPAAKADLSTRALTTLLQSDNPMMAYEAIRMVRTITTLRTDLQIEELLAFWRLCIDQLSILVGAKFDMLKSIWQSISGDMRHEGRVLSNWVAPDPSTPPQEGSLKQYVLMDLIGLTSKVNEHVFVSQNDSRNNHLIDYFCSTMLIAVESVLNGETKAEMPWILGTLYQSTHNFDKSIALYEESLQIPGTEQSSIASVLTNLSNTLRPAGRVEEAWERCLEALRSKLETKMVRNLASSLLGLCSLGIDLGIDKRQLLDVADMSHALYVRTHGERNHRTVAALKMTRQLRQSLGIVQNFKSTLR